MGSRSRKRGRLAGDATAAAASPAAHEPDAPATPTAPASDEPDPLRRRYARGRARDEAIRQSLEPLEPGERPRAVTVAAIVAFAFAIAATVTARGRSPGSSGSRLWRIASSRARPRA